MFIAGLFTLLESFSMDQQGCSVKFVFRLDLTYQYSLGNFDPENGKAYLILKGTEYEMIQSVNDSIREAIFNIIISNEFLDFTDGVRFSYSFKMNSEKESIVRDPVIPTCSDRPLICFFNDEKPTDGRGEQKSNITFVVDMRYQASVGWFNPAEDFVDISGSFNNWDGNVHHLSDLDADSIYEITLGDLTPGQVIEYLYRINGGSGESEFQGTESKRKATVIFEDREVISLFNNYRPGYVPVILSVNMKNEIAKNNFYPGFSFVDVAGSMNGWVGTEELSDNDQDGIYITEPPCIAPEGDTLKYNFRINGSWAEDKSEFYHDQSNRLMFIVDSSGGKTNEAELVWFNNTPLAVSPVNIDPTEVGFVFDQVTNRITLNRLDNIQQINVYSILGRQVLSSKVNNSMYLHMDANGLESGLYILSLVYNSGKYSSIKFIKE
jgi:hypothetical protein